MSCNKVSTWINQAFVQALVPLVLLFTNIDLDCYKYYGVLKSAQWAERDSCTPKLLNLSLQGSFWLSVQYSHGQGVKGNLQGCEFETELSKFLPRQATGSHILSTVVLLNMISRIKSWFWAVSTCNNSSSSAAADILGYNMYTKGDSTADCEILPNQYLPNKEMQSKLSTLQHLAAYAYMPDSHTDCHRGSEAPGLALGF